MCSDCHSVIVRVRAAVCQSKLLWKLRKISRLSSLTGLPGWLEYNGWIARTWCDGLELAGCEVGSSRAAGKP